MSTLPMSAMPVDVEVEDESLELEAEPLITCRDCGDALDLSQPDPQRPEHLLGTCRRCGLWHRIQVVCLRVL